MRNRPLDREHSNAANAKSFGSVRTCDRNHMTRRKYDAEAQERVADQSTALFSVLASETRIAILFALAEAERDEGGPVPFSEIYRRVDLRDSSKFNYHLKTLTERLVERTEDGYQLRYVGRLIYRAIKAGAYVADPVLEPTAVDSRCYKCNATLMASYGDGRLSIECPSCGDLSYRITIPPGALVDRSPDEFLEAADQHIRSDIALAGNGVCSSCAGRTEATLQEPPNAPTDNLYARHECVQCGQRILSTTIGELMLIEPAVIAFCFEHGVDLFANYCWEIGFCVSDEYITILSAEPWRAQFELVLDDDILRITLDDNFDVVETSNSAG